MNITIGDLVASKPALERLLNAQLPVRTAFRLSKLTKLAGSELVAYDEQRIKLCEKYGKINGTQYEFAAADKPQFEREITELASTMVELAFEPVQIHDLGSIEISALDLVMLEPFVADDVEGATPPTKALTSAVN
jgi:hypothetical protein